jgi:hypothetical protein
MEADGAGLKRATNNDGKLGEWDGTTLEEGGSLGKKLTEWRRERSKGSRGEGEAGDFSCTRGCEAAEFTEGERIRW